MPLTEKGRKILANMQEQYGKKRGKQIFWKSVNAGTITGVEEDGGRSRERQTRRIQEGK